MAIKDSKKNISQEAVQKTTKVKAAAGNKMITIEVDEDDESEGFSDLQSSSKVKKKKHLAKQKYPDQTGTKKKKKKKKTSELKNRACANLPIIIESSTESESPTDSRKIPEIVKKKGDGKRSCEREGDYEVACEGLPEEQQRTNFLINLAHKRTVSASNKDDVTFITKQKKKKKVGKKGRHTCPLMSHIRDTEDKFPEEISSNPKVIFQDTVLSGREKGRTSVRNCAGDIVQKKKAAFCLKSADSQEGSNDILEEEIASTKSHFDQGQYCKGKTLGCKQQQKDEMQVSEEETNVITKKQRKKKKKKLEKEKFALFVTSASSQKNSSSVSNENSLKPKSKKILLIVEDKMDLIPDADGEGNMTKKNKIQTKVVGNHLALLKDVKEERRGKKVKKFKVLQVHTASGYDAKIEEKKKKKKKRKDRESEGFQENTEGEPRLKKAKFKKEGKEQEDEIKVVAYKKGNCDEVNIDKLRRQALQEEIDRESGKTRVIKEEKESVDHFGQWGTAAFENSQRKTKFLRLLGGFKKGSSVPVQDSPAHATKPNMALDSSKEEKLHQTLEAEFEKAVHRKCHRGVGLGFQPAAQRYTRIDKYASKSIKFED